MGSAVRTIPPRIRVRISLPIEKAIRPARRPKKMLAVVNRIRGGSKIRIRVAGADA
jgi:hypothetical protein